MLTKRELTDKAYEIGIKPISFFLPKNTIEDINSQINFESNKKFFLAPCDPRDRKSYIYKNEKSYYQQYQDSYFGFTMMKGGWDCLRHYEIIASGSLPYFMNLDKVPTYTLKSYPRDLQKKANELYIKYSKKNSIDKNFVNNYRKLQLGFKKWLADTSVNFGSEDLKMHIQNSYIDSSKLNINILNLIKVNFLGNIEYIRERENKISRKESFLNFSKFCLRNLFFDFLFRFGINDKNKL